MICTSLFLSLWSILEMIAQEEMYGSRKRVPVILEEGNMLYGYPFSVFYCTIQNMHELFVLECRARLNNAHTVRMATLTFLFLSHRVMLIQKIT